MRPPGCFSSSDEGCPVVFFNNPQWGDPLHPTFSSRNGSEEDEVKSGEHTRTGVRIENSDALLTGCVLEETLFGAIVARARQPGEVYQQGDFVGWIGGRLGREVEVEGHFAIGSGGIVGAFEEFAAEAGNGGFFRYGHCVLSVLFL